MSEQTLSNLSREERRFEPPAELAADANVKEEAYARADSDRETFWADAATAKASATKKAMLSFWAGMARAMAMPPITNAAIRATLTSSFSDAVPFFHTLA